MGGLFHFSAIACFSACAFDFAEARFAKASNVERMQLFVASGCASNAARGQDSRTLRIALVRN